MKKSLLFSLFVLCSIFICAETVIDPETKASLKKYYQDNILTLDPIEGIYDVQFRAATSSPYAPTSQENWQCAIYKEGGEYKLYPFSYGKYYGTETWSNYKIIKIADTNAYTFYYYTSSSRIYITGYNSQFTVRLDLDMRSAREFSKNPQFAYKIAIAMNLVKTYPTSSMYIEAAKEDARKAEQEYQKALEEAQKKAGWSGSGFALNQGHIVTNYHVIEDAKTILIKGVKGDFQTELRAKVVATDKVNDIAILKIDDERFKGFGTIPYKVKREMSDVGESVWALGYPMTDVMGEEVKFTDGKISSRTGIQGDMSVYQISVPIQPGNSGGALFDNNGNIVGITSSGLNRETFNSENVNYAIKTSYLYNLIESTLTTSVLPQGTAMQGLPLTQKIKLAKNFVFIIMCSSSSDFHADKLPKQELEKTAENTTIASTPEQKSDPQYKIVVDKPRCVSMSSGGLKIEKVIATTTNTILVCTWHNNNQGTGCSIIKDAYLKVPSSTNKYKLLDARGITYAPQITEVLNGTLLHFSLYFEPIPQSTEKFDFIEKEKSVWNTFDIIIK